MQWIALIWKSHSIDWCLQWLPQHWARLNSRNQTKINNTAFEICYNQFSRALTWKGRSDDHCFSIIWKVPVLTMTFWNLKPSLIHSSSEMSKQFVHDSWSCHDKSFWKVILSSFTNCIFTVFCAHRILLWNQIFLVRTSLKAGICWNSVA